MLRPVDIVRCFHNAFRRDMAEIDALALNVARKGGDIAPVFNRLQVMSQALDHHAQGEETAVFPAFDKITPFVTGAYVMDHRELDSMVSGLEAIRRAPDNLAAARATAVLNSHLRIHLAKEDVYFYPILRERTTDEEQVAIGRVMASKIPQEWFPVQIQWLFPLLDLDDQVKVTRIWMLLIPPPVFAKVKPLIKKSAGANWAALTQQIPELAVE